MNNKPIDAEIHLAMYLASKEAPHSGGWFWSKAFAKALYSISPPVKTVRRNQLFKFYEVSTSDELIEAMERHIEMLQHKLPKSNEHLYTHVREG
jgi:hypothetical protein